ncbi:MAG: AAA family ATPase [Patescibacteria group bacterium]
MTICDKKLIIGLAGEMASGKGTITNYIVQNHNGKNFRFSTILRDILNRLYLEETRENLQKLSTILRDNFGQDVLSSAIAKEAKSSEDKILVMDGVRRLSDIKFLKDFPGFKLVYIEADIKKRFQRISVRGENSDDNTKTFEQFKKELEQESEIQIKGLKKDADYIIDNNGSLEELYAQIDKIIKQLCE